MRGGSIPPQGTGRGRGVTIVNGRRENCFSTKTGGQSSISGCGSGFISYVQPKDRDAVVRRFQDIAISVREAAVTLVGIYVLLVPSLANVFHRPLTLRLRDNGISVVSVEPVSSAS